MSCPFSLATSALAFLGLGFQELLLIAFVALLVFGGNLPEVMQQLGRTYGKFRQSLNELSRPVREELRQVRRLPGPDHDTTSYDSSTPTAEEEAEPLDHPKIQTTPGDDLPDCIARAPDSAEARAPEPADPEEGPVVPEEEQGQAKTAVEIDEPPPV